MATLSDPRSSQTLLVGVADYRSLQPLPHVKNNLAALKQVLMDPNIWGISEGKCTILSEPTSQDLVLEELHRVAELASDTIVVYFSGHGLVDEGSQEEVYLALPGSTARFAFRTAIPFSLIRRELREARHIKRKVVILDCCYSGRAVGWMGDESIELASLLEVDGTCVLTATAATRKALAPEGARFTAFTGELIDVLDSGIPRGPDLIDMDTLYQNLTLRLRAKQMPLPQRGQLDNGGYIAIARNRIRREQLEEPEPGLLSRGVSEERRVPADRATYGNELMSGSAELFKMGPLQTDVLILEGDGAQVIDEQRIHITIESQPVKLPAEMAKWRREILRSQQDLADAGKQHSWNGLNYAVSGFSVSRTILDEEPEIYFRLQASDYFTFLATQQLDRQFKDGSTPRTRYLEPHRKNPQNVPAFMSSSFGTNAAVLTADDYFIFSRRSGAVGTRPNLWSVSANEALSRTLDSRGRSAPKLYDVMRRGIKEELAIEEKEYSLELLNIHIDVKFNLWGGSWIAVLSDLTGDEVRERRTRGAPDKWEHDDLRLVRADPEIMMEFMLEATSAGEMVLGTCSVFYFALVRRFTREEVERALKKILGRQKSAKGRPL